MVVVVLPVAAWVRVAVLCRRLVVVGCVFVFLSSVSGAILSWLLAYQLQVYRFLFARYTVNHRRTAACCAPVLSLEYRISISMRFYYCRVYSDHLLTDSHFNFL